MLYEYECNVCGEIFEEFRSYADRFHVEHCGVKAVKRICQVNTNPDLSYQFVTDIFKGKPVQIRSGRHYRELLKQNNMPDASPMECKQQAAYRARQRKTEIERQHRAVAKEMAREMKDSNVNHVAGEAIRTILKGGDRSGERQGTSPK